MCQNEKHHQPEGYQIVLVKDTHRSNCRLALRCVLDDSRIRLVLVRILDCCLAGSLDHHLVDSLDYHLVGSLNHCPDVVHCHGCWHRTGTS